MNYLYRPSLVIHYGDWGSQEPAMFDKDAWKNKTSNVKPSSEN